MVFIQPLARERLLFVRVPRPFVFLPPKAQIAPFQINSTALIISIRRHVMQVVEIMKIPNTAVVGSR